MQASFFDLTLADLTTALVGAGFNKFAAGQIYDWVYKKNVRDPAQWSNVSKEARAWLAQHYGFSLPKVVWQGLSIDGTRKFLIGFTDGQTV